MMNLVRRWRRPEPSPNTCRYLGVPGHTESYFLRANDPRCPRALWIKATILAPLVGDPIAETWFIWFDGEKGTSVAQKVTQPWSRASFVDRSEIETEIKANGAVLNLAASGSARGLLDGGAGKTGFDLTWTRPGSSVAQPLAMLPLRFLREGPFPKYKINSPFPWLEVSGRVEIPGEVIELTNWSGMQGHNWGREQAFEYAWGQCLFPGQAQEAPAMVEAFTARVRVGNTTTPRVSAMVVRRGAQELRFDRLFEVWRQDAHIEQDRWILRLEGPQGEARLSMDATGKPMVCLGYQNPDGRPSYCFNSKLADVFLQVQPLKGPAFECHSSHGGALEFLRGEPDPRFPNVV